jgi:hypothetical protein
MQAKQKVTLYLSPELHKKLKIRSAIDSEPMSELAERALDFYLANSEIVEEVEASYGGTHRVYACPVCENSVVLRDRELVALGKQPGIVGQEERLPVDEVERDENSHKSKEELVPC